MTYSLRETVEIVLEGWELPPDVRKMLETAYYAPPPTVPEPLSLDDRTKIIVGITETLERLALALPKDRFTAKSCYAVDNVDRDNVHSALAGCKKLLGEN
jgi:hypothetical protein